MPTQKFVETQHCTYNSRCKTCRDAADPSWRRGLTKTFLLPDNNVNFDCPYGVAWIGSKPSPEVVNETPELPVVSLGASPTPAPCGCKGGGMSLSGMTSVEEVKRFFQPEFMSMVPRQACADCTRKHLAQAAILLQESITGHPTHRWFAIGHVAEAISEVRGLFPVVAQSLDVELRKLMRKPEYMPDLMVYIFEVTRLASLLPPTPAE